MYAIGCDVSKKTLDCELLLSRQPLKLRSKSVPNSQSGAHTLIQWACRQAGCTPDQLHVVMEATGVYHEVPAFALVQGKVIVSVVNPARVRDYGLSGS
jgi:transposase